MGTLELAVVGLAGSGVGAALAGPMVWARKSADVRLMGGSLLAMSALIAIVSARVMGLLPATAAVNHLVNLLGFLAYPMLVLYVRERTSAPATSTWWLWVPVAVYAALVLSRLALGQPTRVPFVWLLPIVLGFTAICVVLTFRGRREHHRGLIPVTWLVGLMVIVNVAQIARMLLGHLPLVPALVPVVVACGFVALVARVVWGAVGGPAPVDMPVPAIRYEKSGLAEDTGRALLARIEHSLTTDRLFTDANLTLAGLAAAVDSTPHQVSQVINRYAGVTFHELLSRHRVADVRAQLLDPAADQFTIEGIGMSAGFGSRSALYTAFRRVEGTTPTEFRARRRRSRA